MRKLRLTGQTRLIALIVTMGAVVSLAACFAIWQLYRASLEEQRARLVELAQNQARLIEAIYAQHSDLSPLNAFEKTLAPITTAHERYDGLGETGEFSLAHREGDLIRFVLNHRHSELVLPEPVPLESDLAQPMRRALAGASGTLIGADYRGATVLAAHEPIRLRGLTVGIVAKIDLAEVRAPFVEAGKISGAGALLVVCLGAVLFWYLGAPIMQRELGNRRFREKLMEAAPDAIIICDVTGRIILVNRQTERIFGYGRSELLGRPVELLLPEGARKNHVQFRERFTASGETSLMGEGRALYGITKDGRELPIEVGLSVIDTDTGRVVAAAIRDITDRVAANAALAQSKSALEAKVRELESLQQRLEGQAADAVKMAQELSEAKAQLYDAVESISEGFALWDADDRLIMCNERYRHMYTEIADILVPGLSFQAFLRAAHGRGIFMIGEAEDLETVIADRVNRHRTTVSAFEQQLGNGRWVRVSKRQTKTGHVVGILTDVSDRKQSEAMIKRMAHQDSLTSLPNRTLFLERLEEATAYSRRNDRIVALMLLDLDNFKKVNDTFGHPAGDELLQQVSRRLFNCIRVTDTVARLGGDEFAIIATQVKSLHDINILAERIVASMDKPFQLDSHEVYTGTSIGITVFPHDDGDTHQLMRNADLALYRAKEDGRGGYQVYDEHLNAEMQARRQLEMDLRVAIERDELHVVYQPQFDIESGAIIGAEALLRWTHPTRGPVSPGEFIPVAEATRLIIPISQWILETVCNQIRQWRAAGLPEICISVNVSPLQFRQDDMVQQLTEVLHNNELAPHWLELEITEGIAMEAGDDILEILTRLKSLGINLAIDDFGTGFSSLNRLKKFPVDRIKIDQSFVRDITTDMNDAAISAAVVRLGHSLNLTVIAEGVETVQQLEFLAEQDCDEIQGYLMSKPLKAADFEAFLTSYDRSTFPGAKAPEEIRAHG